MENPMDEWTAAMKRERELAAEVTRLEYAIVMEAAWVCRIHASNETIRLRKFVEERDAAVRAHLDQMAKTNEAMKEAAIAFPNNFLEMLDAN